MATYKLYWTEEHKFELPYNIEAETLDEAKELALDIVGEPVEPYDILTTDWDLEECDANI
jgi:hypothetical protein|tara:strand:+ start:543 stop:722 length:180 start_codon:yes stop_codon:yes gene_type:complete